MNEISVQSGNDEMFAVVEGDGPAVVLLHGGNGTHADIEPFAAQLPDRFTVIAPDIRGWGRSASPDIADHNPRQYADDVVAILDHLAIDQAALCGASLGSVVALATAIHHPERVSALVLMAPALIPGRPRGPELQALLDSWVAVADRLDAHGVEATLTWVDENPVPLNSEALRRHDPGSLSASLRSIATLMPAERLEDIAAITAPTLVIPGLDPVHDPEIGAIYARTIPGSSVAEVRLDGPELVELRASGNAAELQAYVQNVATQLGQITATFLDHHFDTAAR